MTNIFAWIGFIVFLVSMVVILILLVGLGYGWEASNSGEWWITSLSGAGIGFLALILGDLVRRVGW